MVDHPQRQRFLELRDRADELQALEEAQSILVSCGAISYAVHELMARHEQALSRLGALAPPNPKPLETLLAEVIAPVERLFARVDKENK